MALERENIALQQELETIESVNLVLREQLDRVQTDNKTLNNENNFLRKKVSSFQQETANHHNEYSRIETELYQKSEEIERLKKENISLLKNKRDADRKLSEEILAFEKDRQAWHEREAELVNQLKKALRVAVNNIEHQSKRHQRKHSQTSNSNDDSPPESPTTTLYNVEREAKIAQRTIKEQDRLIYQLKAEIEKAKSATGDSLQLNKDLEFKIAILGKELEQVKRMKRSLEEENEAFQLLLHEKTIKGEFMLNPILQHNGLNNSRNASRTSLREVTGVSLTDEINNALPSGKREKKGRRKHKVPNFTNLATELDRASGACASPAGERVQKEQGVDSDDEQLVFSVEDLEKLQEDIKSLQDENKCLRVYINTILARIMEAQGFEEILSTDWSKKTPSQPSTPTVTTFDNIRNLTKVNNTTEPSPPVVKKANDIATPPKKVGRRKTFSVFSSEKKLAITKIQTAQNDERTDQLSPLPASTTHVRNPSEGFLSPPPQRRQQRRNSTSDGGSSKRWSLWWNTNGKQQPIERKEDPYMRPMVLVQDD